jgi:hypothetical protein
MRARLKQWRADPCAVFDDLRRALPDHFTLPPAPFHLELLNWWTTFSFNRDPKGSAPHAMPTTSPCDSGAMPTALRGHAGAPRHLNLIAPRGYAKSTLVSLAIPLLASTTKQTRYIVLTSATASQAAQHLTSLAAALESAADYWDFPALKPSKRSKSRLLTKGGVRIDALGAQEQLRGRRHHARRPDLIIADDVESEDCQFSPTIREQTQNWFTGAVLNAGHPETCYIVVSTPLHTTSLCFQLAASDQWKTIHHSALAADPEETLWNQWQREFKNDPSAARAWLASRRVHPGGLSQLWEANPFADDPRDASGAMPTALRGHADHPAQFTPLWPELESTLALWEHRLNIGPIAFAREKMCRPKSGAHADFNPTYFARPLAPQMAPIPTPAASPALPPAPEPPGVTGPPSPSSASKTTTSTPTSAFTAARSTNPSTSLPATSPNSSPTSSTSNQTASNNSSPPSCVAA